MPATALGRPFPSARNASPDRLATYPPPGDTHAVCVCPDDAPSSSAHPGPHTNRKRLNLCIWVDVEAVPLRELNNLRARSGSIKGAEWALRRLVSEYH